MQAELQQLPQPCGLDQPDLRSVLLQLAQQPPLQEKMQPSQLPQRSLNSRPAASPCLLQQTLLSLAMAREAANQATQLRLSQLSRRMCREGDPDPLPGAPASAVALQQDPQLLPQQQRVQHGKRQLQPHGQLWKVLGSREQGQSQGEARAENLGACQRSARCRCERCQQQRRRYVLLHVH